MFKRAGVAMAGALAIGAAVAVLPAATASADTTGNIALGFNATGWLYQEQASVSPYNSTQLQSAGDASFAQPGFDTSGYSVGQAPFSNNANCGFVGSTSWAANTDLLAVHSFTLPAGAYNVRIRGTVDNDASVFVNGTNVGIDTAGFCEMNSIDMSVPQSLVTSGANLLAVRAHDYGGATFLDVQVTYTLDTTPPQLLGMPQNMTTSATGSSGATVNWTLPTATDNLDPAPTVSCDHQPGDTYPLGTTTVTCTATDAAGNQSSGSFTITVTYDWCGVLQPINADGSSIFKLGSTVPVKFCLNGASAGITDATANLSYQKISGAVAGTVTEATSTSAATTGSLFRYDPTSGQYIFNWSTKGLTSGTYLLGIDLHDGVSRTVQVSVK